LGLSLASSGGSAQALPVSDPLLLSGTKLIPSEGRLYFGDAERAYEYDPAAASRSGRGLTRAIDPVATDWQAFLRSQGRAFLPVVGGTRDGKECYRGMRRFDPASEGLVFSTKFCLLPEDFPAVLAGADDFHVAGGRLYYTRQGTVYSTDGAAGGERSHADLSSGHTPFLVNGTRALFAGGRNARDWSVYEINDKTGLQLVGTTDVRFEGPFVQLGSALYGVGTGATYGKELYRFDLTTRKTTVVTDLTFGPDGSNPGGLTLFRDAVYLHADGQYGNELYRADAHGMALVRDIHPTGSATPRELTANGDWLYFRADDGSLGEELWQTNGTSTGTRMVRDFRRGKRGARPSGLVSLDGRLYAWMNEGLWGEGLWRLRKGESEFELVEATALVESLSIDGKLDDWPQRYDDRTIRDPAGDVDVTGAIDFVRAKVAIFRGGLIVGYEVVAPFSLSGIADHHVLFEVDDRLETGWKMWVPFQSSFGADYMIEGITLYRYAGSGNDWTWERVEEGGWRASDAGVEVYFGQVVVGTGILGSKVALMGRNLKLNDLAAYDSP
jgi:ELWxxDGT repeat protein